MAFHRLFGLADDGADGGEQLRAIPGESVARMRMELALPDVDSLSAKVWLAFERTWARILWW